MYTVSMDEKKALQRAIRFLEDDIYLEDIPTVDAIFVFGNTDRRVAEHAALLYMMKKSTRIILTGKGRREIPGYESEALYYADILLNEGIPEQSLILEETSMNILENVVFGIEHCARTAFSPQSVALVSIPPLLRRAHATFEKQFPDIRTYGSAFHVSLQEYESRITYLLREYDHLDAYAARQDIAPVVVPNDVREAVEFLKGLASYKMDENEHFS